MSSLVIGTLFLFLLHWFNENIYRPYPILDILSPEYLDTGIDWIVGFFVVSVIPAIKRGRMQILHNPSRFLGEDLFAFLSSRFTSVVLLVSSVILFLVMIGSPSLYIDHNETGERPTVIIDGTVRHFAGSTVALRPDADGAVSSNNYEVQIVGRHNLYSTRVVPSDFQPNRLLFSKHARLDLASSDLFITRDFQAELFTASEESLGTFEFTYSEDESLSDQCRDSDSIFWQHFEGDNCDRFFRSLFEHIANTERRLLESQDGDFVYDDRLFRYEYEFRPTLRIKITLPEAQSVLGNQPLAAFDNYLDADSERRSTLVAEFEKDTRTVPARRLSQIFEVLASTGSIWENLEGTTAIRRDTLSFIKHVLALGVEHSRSFNIRQWVDDVSRTNLHLHSHPDNMVMALDVVMALTSADSRIRQETLERVEEFASDLGTNSNSRKPEIARILLTHVDNYTELEEVRRIAGIVGQLWRSAKGVNGIPDAIRGEITSSLDQVQNEVVRTRLRDFESANAP